MTNLQPQGLTRGDYLQRNGTLAVVRPLSAAGDVNAADPVALEPFVIIEAGGSILAFNGHVDLGTGIRTALAQIVAEELDVAFERVTIILGDTGVAPDQGPTIASETIQVTAVPLRKAAAQARAYLIAQAAARWALNEEDLTIEEGLIRPKAPDNRTLSYGDIIGADRIRLALAADVEVKAPRDYRIVGKSQPRVDLPAKATGGLVYVHDMRLPGMVHGRVVRPPYAGVDAGDFVGRSLVSVDDSSVAHIPGVLAVVTIGDFVGVVAEREENAEAAMRALRVTWKPAPPLPDLKDVPDALMANPSRPRTLLDRGNADAAIAGAAKRMTRSYVWPYQMHASIGPSAAVADYEDGRLRVWSGTQSPLPLRADLARLLDLPESAVELIRMEAAGCYGRNCADDVTADAALLSRAVGKPIRVQLTRDQEHLWEPKGAAQFMAVDGGLDASGGVAAYDFSSRYPSNGAPTLALLLTGKVAPTPAIFEMGDRTAIGPYDFENHRVTVHDMPPIVRAAWLRGVSALPNTFAHECYIDECAAEAGADPVEYRLRYLKDRRAIELVQQLAKRAGWTPRPAPAMERDDDGLLHGRGFAYALYVHSKFPGYGAAWSAWVADVAVDPGTGEVALTKITVGQDSGLMINPDGVKHQIHGNVIQSASRVLKEEVTFSKIAVASREWGSYPLLTFPEVPPVDVLMIPRPEEEPLGVGESASVPSAAAIANAIFDATGVRFREVPFTPERILKGLRAGGIGAPPSTISLPKQAREAASKKLSRLWPVAVAAFGAIGSIGLVTLPLRGGIAPIPRPDPAVYSAAAIEHGRVLSHLGGCISCHTAEGGAQLAGGLEIKTPFGKIFSTNITPDPITGIGNWSFPAFERSMREGLHRDGSHLYPAFPYTSFAKASEADLEALYAFLMAQPAVSQANREPDLAFPLRARSMMAAWNTMFHKAEVFEPQAGRTALWNRGAYLVESLGHCSACHSPRNAFGAEEAGKRHLSGGVAQGWEAPSLTALSNEPVPWDEQAFYDYLRTGFSALHGAAAGPMATVIVNLKPMPDEEIRAMAHYLASLNPDLKPPHELAALAQSLETAARSRAPHLTSMPGANIYEGACAVCHDQGRGVPMFGVKPSLALNSAVHAATPDTVIRVILEGIRVPDIGGIGAMPSYAHHLDDGQIVELAKYIRLRFAPQKPEWRDLPATAARLRSTILTHAGS